MSHSYNMVDKILAGKGITKEEARKLWSCDFYDLLHASNKIRLHFKGEEINLCSIINAKSGHCGENCRFCAQSVHHKTKVSVYPMVTKNAIAKHFKAAQKAGAKCFGIVTSGRRLSRKDITIVCEAAKELRTCSLNPAASAAGVRQNLVAVGRIIKGASGSCQMGATNHVTRLSASLGELDESSFKQLKKSGITRFHHNLETSENYFPSICSSHNYEDRVRTIRRAKSAGLEVCSGGIFGMGETWEDRLEFGFALKALRVDSIPMNFLNPVKGTPLENEPRLSAREILTTIALFRFILPDKDISVCGGREYNLRDLESWIFYAGANGMMVGGYLTTSGRPVKRDLEMIYDLGLTIHS